MTELLTSQLGTVTHMPPELIQLEDGARCADFGGVFDTALGEDKRLSKKADIYAIGMLAYEAALGEVPYRGMMAPQIILFVAMGKSLPLPETMDPTIREVFLRCTDRQASGRPSAEALEELLM
eukprot:g17970.t1